MILILPTDGRLAKCCLVYVGKSKVLGSIPGMAGNPRMFRLYLCGPVQYTVVCIKQ